MSGLVYRSEADRQLAEEFARRTRVPLLARRDDPRYYVPANNWTARRMAGLGFRRAKTPLLTNCST